MTRNTMIVASAVTLVVIGFVAIAALSVVGFADQAQAERNLQRRDEGGLDLLPGLQLLSAVGDIIPNTWSVGFRDDAPMATIETQIETLTACTIRNSYADFQILSITCPPLALTGLLALTIVLQHGVYYEPEIRWTSGQTQSSAPWGLDRSDQRNLPLSGTYNPAGYDGTGVDAHILDTGIFAAHTDFGGRVQAGYDAINDGRATTTDCQGHGTHVAGTVGGTTSGLAKKVNLYASRVLGCDGSGSTSGIVAAMRWVASQTTGRRKVINMSLGGGQSSSFDSVVAEVTNKGVVVVVAAGNENQDACNVSPARAPSAITVMASDRSDQRASFSNYGSCADIIAPGVSIVSNSNSSTTGRVIMSGTSMASPHVAGVVALILQAFPSYSVAQVTSYLTSTSTPNKITGLDANSPNRLLFWGAPTSGTSTSTSTSTSTTSTSRTSSSQGCTTFLCLRGEPARTRIM